MELAKKKTLFVITYLELGGVQRQLLSLIKNLNPDKYALYLFAGDYGYLRSEFTNLSYLNIRLIRELTRKLHPLYDFIAFIKLYFYIKKNKFDIVHTHSPKASILARWAAYLAGVRNIIYTVHGWPFHKFMNSLLYYFYLFLEKITAKITQKIIVVSYADLKTGIDSKVAPKDKFTLIHYGIDVDRFDRLFREREIKPANSIITVSSLKPQKGLCYFLEMAKDLLRERPDLNFIVIGDGPLRKKIERKIRLFNLEDKVLLKGWVDDISCIFINGAVFVLTSLWEGLPVSLIEAVVAGIPIVVTDTGGILDIIKDKKQGLIIETANSLEAKETCLKILQDYENWSKIIATNRNNLNLSYWSCGRMIRDVENIYENLKC